jgi:hypothetical protein
MIEPFWGLGRIKMEGFRIVLLRGTSRIHMHPTDGREAKKTAWNPLTSAQRFTI